MTDYKVNEPEPTTDVVVQPSGDTSISANPLDLPTEQFKDALDRRGANRDVLMKWIRNSLVEGIDFGRIAFKGGGRSKPSLWKAGAQKILGKLGVIANFPTLNDYEGLALNNKDIDKIVIRCELVNPSGECIATGIGARIVDEDRGDLNKALKMAKKSALIDSVLDMGGLSEIFTQDIEDMRHLHDDGSGHDSEYPTEPYGSQSKPQQEHEWSAESREQLIHFGKHKGKKWSDPEVEDGYLEWMVSSATNPDFKLDKWIPKFAELELIHRERGGDDDTTQEDEEKGHKHYPDDYTKTELITMIQERLEPRFIKLYGADGYRRAFTERLGTEGMVNQNKGNLEKFIADMGDMIRQGEAEHDKGD